MTSIRLHRNVGATMSPLTSTLVHAPSWLSDVLDEIEEPHLHLGDPASMLSSLASPPAGCVVYADAIARGLVCGACGGDSASLMMQGSGLRRVTRRRLQVGLELLGLTPARPVSPWNAP